MKTFPTTFFAIVASLATAAESATLEQMFISERRFTLFNSRALSGGCCKFSAFATHWWRNLSTMMVSLGVTYTYFAISSPLSKHL